MLTQVGWLLQGDPFVLLQLRGLSREDLLAGLHALTARRSGIDGGPARSRGPASDDLVADDPAAEDLAVAEDAALRAARMLAAIEQDPEADLGRWW